MSIDEIVTRLLAWGMTYAEIRKLTSHQIQTHWLSREAYNERKALRSVVL